MVKNLKDLMTKFKDEQACRDYLVKQRWNGVPECPHCGCRQSYKIENGKRFKCANRKCWKKYSVTVGTIFEASNIPLSTWFPAVYILTAHKKGISSVQLAKNLGVTQKTAWFIIHRIRESLKEKAPLLLQKEVQVDESYIGGVEGNKHKDKRQRSPTALKMPVVGLIETGGNVVAQVTPIIGARAAKTIIQKHVDTKATLVTDTALIYKHIGRLYNHIKINHSQGEFKVKQFHTNSIENFWSHLQRTIYGTYHQVSPKHLQRYCDESAYRFNSRKLSDGFRFVLTLHQIEGRLTYKQLVYGQSEENQAGKDVQTIETGE